MEEEKIKQLLKLIEQWTRAEIMARHGHIQLVQEGEDGRLVGFSHIHLKKEDEIRELLYGSSNLQKLGEKWNLFKDAEAQIKTQTKEDNVAKFKQLQREIDAML